MAPPDRTTHRTAPEQGARDDDQGAPFNPRLAPMMQPMRVATIQSAVLFHLDHHWFADIPHLENQDFEIIGRT